MQTKFCERIDFFHCNSLGGLIESFVVVVVVVVDVAAAVAIPIRLLFFFTSYFGSSFFTIQ